MLKKFIKNKSGINQSIVSIFGNFFATGLSAVALILITRILGPERFGIFSVGFSIVLILSRINEVGLNTAIVKFASSSNTQKEKNLIYSIVLKYKLIISTVIFSIGIFFSSIVANQLNFSEVYIIKLAFTIGLVTVYYEQLLYTLQSLHRFTESVVINAIQATSKLIGASILFLIGVNNVSVIFFAYIVSPIVPVIFSKRLLPVWLKINIKSNNSKVQSKLFGLAKHSSVALISAGIIENIDILFLQRHLSTYEAGLYGGVSRIAMMFSLIAYSLGNVLNARVAKYKDKEHLKQYIKKATIVSILSFLSFIAFIPFAKYLILFTIGEQYISGLSILITLSGASFLAVASIPFIALFYSFNANWYFSLSGILQLIIVLVGNFVFVPIYGLEAAAWTRVATRLFLFLFVISTSMTLYYRNYVKNNQ
jgi:O-antigen/teichoic acid export membrane protein